jgi:hypothetical protein
MAVVAVEVLVLLAVMEQQPLVVMAVMVLRRQLQVHL